MCHCTYEHSGYECMDERRNTDPAMRSLEWTIRKETREIELRGKGINLVFCCHRIKGLREHDVEIQENRGKYTLLVDNKPYCSADRLDDCVSRGKAAGYIAKNEMFPDKRKATSKTTPVVKRSKKTFPETMIKATPLTKQSIDPQPNKLYGNRPAVSGRRLGWR